MAETRNGSHGNNDQGNGQNRGPQPNRQIRAQDLFQLMQVFIATANARPLPTTTRRATTTWNTNQNEFCKRRPPYFQREPNPIADDFWLEEIKKILKVLDIQSDGDKIALATYQMQGEAQHWWSWWRTPMTRQPWLGLDLRRSSSTNTSLPQSNKPWFKNSLTLNRVTLTVTQYATHFKELSRHATTIIPTDDDKAIKFEWELFGTRRPVVAQTLPTYSQVVKCALMMERESSDYKSSLEQRRTGPTAGGPIHINNNNRTFPTPKPYFQNNQNNPRPQQHNRPWRNQGQGQGQNQSLGQNRNKEPVRCFNGNEEGHYKNRCPQLKNNGNNGYGSLQLQAKPNGNGNQYQGGQSQPCNGWNQQQPRPFQNNGPSGQNQLQAGYLHCKELRKNMTLFWFKVLLYCIVLVFKHYLSQEPRTLSYLLHVSLLLD